MSETPSYIKSLVTPNGKKPQGRKAWSIDLETIWIPFFLATNTAGDTKMPHDALGCPIRLAYNPDGSVKFSKTGRAVTKVAKDLADAIRVVRDNFSAGLLGYSIQVQKENKEGYQTQIAMARKAGEPIIANDRAKLNDAIAKAMAEAIAKAEAEAKAKAKAKAPSRVKVPVTA
jgi:hypothetical protein